MSEDSGWIEVHGKPIPKGAMRWLVHQDGSITMRTPVFLLGFRIWHIERHLTHAQAIGVYNLFVEKLLTPKDVCALRDHLNKQYDELSVAEKMRLSEREYRYDA